MRWIPKIVSMVLLWSVVGFMVLRVDPVLLRDIVVPGIYFPFLVAVFAATWYTLALALQSGMFALAMSIVAVGGILMSMVGLMYPLLALGLLALEVLLGYWRFRKR